MATTAPEGTPVLEAENGVVPAEASGEKERSIDEPETEQPSCVEPKMEAGGAEASEEKPAAAADKAASEAATGAVTVNQEATTAAEEPEQRPEPLQNPGDGINETTGDGAQKETKEEPSEDSSRCSETDCEKSKTACEDSDKPSGGGGEMGDKRRPSVEISSSDGEPLSRLDSEDRSVKNTTGCFCTVLGVNL